MSIYPKSKHHRNKPAYPEELSDLKLEHLAQLQALDFLQRVEEDEAYDARANLLKHGNTSHGPTNLMSWVIEYVEAIGDSEVAALLKRKMALKRFKPYIALENELYTLATGKE